MKPQNGNDVKNDVKIWAGMAWKLKSSNDYRYISSRTSNDVHWQRYDGDGNYCWDGVCSIEHFLSITERQATPEEIATFKTEQYNEELENRYGWFSELPRHMRTAILDAMFERKTNETNKR